MSLPSKERSAETLAVELGHSLKQLRDALRVTLRLVQQLEHHSDFVARIAEGRPVRIRRQQGAGPRLRGRPPGAKNGVTLFAGPAEVARLRAELGLREACTEGEALEGAEGGAGGNRAILEHPRGAYEGLVGG